MQKSWIKRWKIPRIARAKIRNMKALILFLIIGVLVIASLSFVAYSAKNSENIQEKKGEMQGSSGAQNLTSCFEIENETEKDACFLDVAINGNNASVCLLISHPTPRGDCFLITGG